MSNEAALQRKWDRAILRREMRAGRINMETILRDNAEHVVEMPLISVLEMIPYVGYVRIAELNYEAMKKGINICLPVGALTDRAKSFIVEWEKNRTLKSTV